MAKASNSFNVQEERTSGPHSYLAGYVLLAIGGVLAIVIIVVASVKNFWGDRPMERCETKLDRAAQAVQEEFRKSNGELPEKLREEFEASLIRCPLCRDDEMGTAVYRYRVIDRDTFELECRYQAHQLMGGTFPVRRYRASLTEELTVLSTPSATPNQ